jgi:lantibiotic biosynthesis protein
VGRDPFAARSLGGLARVPLLPAEAARDHSLSAADPLLMEGVLLASRQVGAAALSPASPLDDRLAVTLRSYEIRARWRPTPHGAFAGVALARFSPGASDLRLGGGHRARSNPSALWLAAVATQLLDDPEVLSHLTLTTSNLVIRRGRRFEHEQQAPIGGAGPQRVTIPRH